MPRCCYRHNAFRQEGYRHDGSDQCWMTDVRKFREGKGSGVHKHYCIFHAPDNQNPVESKDWSVEIRGEMQATWFRALLDGWNEENARRKADGRSAQTFLLPGLRCGAVSFHGYKFSGPIDIRLATFSGDVRFDSATFSGYAGLISATFSGNAWFISATFNGNAWFISTSFSGDAWFSSAIFSGNAWFSSAIFSGDAGFSSATFSGNARFGSTSFSGDAGFSSATFDKLSAFTNCKFGSATTFANSYFARVPVFHGATLHQGTDFRGAVFEDRTSREAPLAYRTLKLAMGDVQSRQEEARFHALEQESRRHQPDTPVAVKLSSLLYEKLSNYGQSFLRPLGWLGGSSVFFWLVYSLVLYFVENLAAPVTFLTDFTVRQIVRPFDAWAADGMRSLGEYLSTRGLPPISGDVAFTIKMLAAFQSLSALVFVTLFLLAVRREFKLD